MEQSNLNHQTSEQANTSSDNDEPRSTTETPNDSAPPAIVENYPVIATLETSVLGEADSSDPVEIRLAKLEKVLYRQTFPAQTSFERTERLKVTLIGPEELKGSDSNRFMHPSQMAADTFSPVNADYKNLAQDFQDQKEMNREDALGFFVRLVNSERKKYGFGALAIDEIAQNVAVSHIKELCKRGLLTHQDLRGKNPDSRYTTAGGTGLMLESLVSLKTDKLNRKLIKTNIAQLANTMLQKADERDAMLSPDATGIGFAMNLDAHEDKFIACCNVITHHGIIQPIPLCCNVGDKVVVSGIVTEPYKFKKITLAWETDNSKLATVEDEAEEALPYFAPRDYGAFAKNSDMDYPIGSYSMSAPGFFASMLSGVFMSPANLAAPGFAQFGGLGGYEPKPASGVSVKGGVHSNGKYFRGKIPINHGSKEGLYYVTIWAAKDNNEKPVPISRRIVVTNSIKKASLGGAAAVDLFGPRF